MLGALGGDIIGSIYEGHNIKSKKFPLFGNNNRFTDDSVMTCAIANAAVSYSKFKDYDRFRQSCINNMQYLGRTHLNAGYGGRFINWIVSQNPQPYNSYGNGSAMRVSSVAYVADSLEEAEKLAEVSAEVTHNHPDGIAGAKVVAGSIWLLLNGSSKEEVRNYAKNFYNVDFKLDDIRDNYRFDVSCKGSVPQAIVAFLEGKDYEDTVRNAISIGGDSDTIAAIAGGIAEAYYGIPKEIEDKIISYLDSYLLSSLNKFVARNNDFSNEMHM